MPYDILIGRDDADKKRFGKKGLVKIGRGYVKMGQYTSLSNPIYLDVARSHVILVAGKRGSGKSYTLSVISEELSSLPQEEASNIGSLIFDTMGIFWTMKYPNQKEVNLLSEWNLKPKKLPCRIFVPHGYYQDFLDREIPVDQTFSIKPSELQAEDWILTFNLEMTNPLSILIERTITKLKEQENYTIEDIKKTIESQQKTSQEIKNSAVGLFEAASSWKIFSEEATPINELIKPGITTILDLSSYSSVGAFNVRALVISLISRKLFNERMLSRKKEEVESIRRGEDYLSFTRERDLPLIWLFIDEVHEFLPDEGKTPATDALIQLLREGRQPGISIVMATQQPGALSRDAITQSDIVIGHRVTAQPDIQALNDMMQTYLVESIKKHMDDLPNLKGSAIILDDNSERIYPCRIRPKLTWHGGEAPTSVKVERRI